MQRKKEIQYPIRWGLIGCGAVTELKSGPAYHKTDGFKLAAVMRRNLALAQDY
ncbi:MAG: gfo/Idh/MocA family oxidoreductase, partial [Moritella sp.]|nr:gfo/Idh/MocA family oxidoreductase [Moritella sp.]